jgi:L-ascorbate metabolism protein UlaG (beta-lactamase superfamily)
MRLDLLFAVSLFPALLLPSAPAFAAEPLPVDHIPTSAGDLAITFVGHGSLVFGFAGKTVHVDPWGKLADYKALPKADLILVTHDHPDHLDPAAIAAASKAGTVIVANGTAGAKLPGAKVLANGEGGTFAGFAVRAVPAYNRVNMRPDGKPFHPRGEGNGYLISFGDKKVYVAGDTEDIPEMKELGVLPGGVDVAFLPVNLPYTMTPEMLVEAAKMVKPKVLYPYHTGDTDLDRVDELLDWVPGMEVRIRPME